MSLCDLHRFMYLDLHRVAIPPRSNGPWFLRPAHRAGIWLRQLSIHPNGVREKKQIGDLLHDFKRIGNTARPESVPDAVNLITNFTG